MLLSSDTHAVDRAQLLMGQGKLFQLILRVVWSCFLPASHCILIVHLNEKELKGTKPFFPL